MTRRLAAVLALAAAALTVVVLQPRRVRPTQSPPLTVLCLGDSITLGITRGGIPADMDPDGGYPGRLQRRLGGSVRVLNRGLGGATAGMWMAAPGTSDGWWARQLLGVSHWPDVTFDQAAVSSDKSVAELVLGDVRPDVVIVLLGIPVFALLRRRVER